MEINYIILAHKNPEQLDRLINSLQEEGVRFYIHIDRNFQKEPFQQSLIKYSNIYMLDDTERMPGTWGDIGIVKGTINAMKRVLDEKRKGFTILLTGQDYPLQKKNSIYRYFKNSSCDAYITLYPIPNMILENGGMPRIKKYKINKATKRGYFLLLPSIFDRDFYKWKSLGKLNYLRKTGKWNEIKKIFIKRRHPKYLKPYAGGVYWALSAKIIKRILDFIESHPDYLEYHRYSLCADEIFFHSIIAQLKRTEPFRLNRSLTYVNWERPSGPLPVTFEKEDFEELRKASKNHLFARKFDIEKDSKILDLIDYKLLD